ncbi:MAG TPA: hypothetical protein VFN35_24065 [Ktedonobacteraceae bacterium]|nr:hypothetical protein [Ktedonobacteraceae bacterium]
MKPFLFRSLASESQKRPRVIWLAAFPLALGLLLAFTLLSSPAAFAATHTPTTSKLAATNSGVIPFSASGCVGNLPTNNVQTCFTIIGNGTFVQGMAVSIFVRHSAVTAALQITGPQGFADFTAFVLVGPGHGVTFPVTLQRNMPVGQYCGASILIQGTGAGKACETVRA